MKWSSVLSVGTASCLALVMVASIGCPPLPPATNACSGNPCDDNNPCTEDTCTLDANAAEGRVCSNGLVECDDPDQICNPADGECVDCVTNADCDDAEFCNGAETCAADNTCAAGTDPCDPATEACDETNDTCEPICTGDADCDDGLFCNGAETCDLATGLCAAGTDPCAAGETCDEDTDTCIPPVPECSTDADCPDDGLFCTGDEFCNTTGVAGFCDATGDPCAAGETCDEATDTCTPPPVECNSNGDCPDDGLFCTGEEFCNTSGVSFFCDTTGNPCAAGETCADDTDACFTPGNVFTLTTEDDAITGTPGNDTFTASIGTLNPGDIVVGNGGTDVMNATVAGNTSSEATLIDIDTVSFKTLNAVTFDTVNSAAVGEFAAAAGSSGNLTLTSLEEGTALRMGAGYTRRLRATLFDDSAADDEMDLTIDGTQEGASFDYLMNADPLETLNLIVIGSTLSPANPGVDLFGDVDEALVTGDGDLTFSGVNPVDLAANAPDTFDFDGTLTIEPAADAVHVFDFTAGNLVGVDNYVITDTLTFAHSVTLNAGDTPFNIDISNIDEDDSAGAVTVIYAGAGTNNEINLTLGGVGDGMGAFTAATTEFINIVSGGTTANAIANVTGETGTDFVTETVTVTGDQDIDLGTVTTEKVDASGLTGGLTMTAAGSMAITSGSGDDDITGSAAVDLIDTGDGNNTVTGMAGNDIITLGDGDDIVVLVSVFAAVPANADGGAAPGDSVTGFAGADAIELDGTNAFADGTGDLTNTDACTDDSIDIANDGTDTTIRIDLDTDAGALEATCVTITLEGVTFDDTDFTFDATDDLLLLQ